MQDTVHFNVVCIINSVCCTLNPHYQLYLCFLKPIGWNVYKSQPYLWYMYSFFSKENNVLLRYDWKSSILVDWLVQTHCISNYMYLGKEKLSSLYSKSIIYLYTLYIFDPAEKKNENIVYLKTTFINILKLHVLIVFDLDEIVFFVLRTTFVSNPDSCICTVKS